MNFVSFKDTTGKLNIEINPEEVSSLSSDTKGLYTTINMKGGESHIVKDNIDGVKIKLSIT